MLFLYLLLTLLLSGCATFGQSPSQQDLVRYQGSKQFDQQAQRFVSPNQNHIEQFKADLLTVKHVFRALTEAKHTAPESPIPQQSLTPEVIKHFYQNKDDTQWIWLGHSTVLLSLSGKIILIDPIFAHAGPAWFIGQRFQDPALALSDLPYVDWVLISHDHYDHLEMQTIKALAPTNTQFFVPLGVGRHLNKWGVPQNRIHEKDWWESIELNSRIHITLTPAQHYSGRSGFMKNDTLWGSFAITSPKHRLFFSGDSGFGEHFKTIGEKLGPFDVAFIENGQYLDIARPVHLLPEDTLQTFYDLNAKQLVPIHWGAYALSLHPWCEPPAQLLHLAKKEAVAPSIHIPEQGEVINVSQFRGGQKKSRTVFTCPAF